MIIQIHQMWPGDLDRPHEFVSEREFKTQNELDEFVGGGGLGDWMDEVQNSHELSDGGIYEVCNEFAPCVVWTAKATDTTAKETELAISAAVALSQL